MSEEALHLASTLAAQACTADGAAEPPHEKRSRSPEEVLKLLIAIRRVRLRQFEIVRFANPGWDVLLDLMLARTTGRKVPVSSACVAAGIPATTALRLVSDLVAAGLVRRLPDPDDKRRVLVDLTEDGRSRMEIFLRAVARLVG